MTKTFSQLSKEVTSANVKRMAKMDVDQGALNKNGVPTAVVFHGSHSLEGLTGNDDDADGGVGGSQYLKQQRRVDEKEKGDDFFIRNENSHIHPDEYQVHKQLMNSQRREGMDHYHIRKYTEGSRILNKALWHAHNSGTKAPAKVEGWNHTHDVKALDKAVHRNSLGRDLHVYSGIAFDPSKVAEKHPEGHIHLPAYTSTSTDKNIARNFAAQQGEDKPHLKEGGVQGHIMHIHLKRGQPGAYIHGDESKYHDEREFLLPRSSTLKYHGHSDHHDVFDDMYRVHHFTVD